MDGVMPPGLPAVVWSPDHTTRPTEGLQFWPLAVAAFLIALRQEETYGRESVVVGNHDTTWRMLCFQI